MVGNFAVIWMDIDDLAHLERADVALDRQCAGIFHRVEKDGGNFAAQYEATITLVWNMRDVVPHVPEH